MRALYCIDWTELGDTPPMLGGYWDEEEIAYFHIHINSCSVKGGEECASFEIAKDFLEGKYLYYSIFVPSYYMETESIEKPIQTYFKNIFIELNPSVGVVEDLTMEVGALEDDIGLIFKDKRQFQGVKVDSSRLMFSTINPDLNDWFQLCNTNIYFGKSEAKITRSFVKLQELAAEVAPMAKLLHIFLGFIAKYYSEFDIFRQLTQKKAVPSVSLNNNVSSQGGTIINNLTPKLKKKEKCTKLSFLSYIFRSVRTNDKVTQFKTQKERLLRFFEVRSILEICERNYYSQTN